MKAPAPVLTGPADIRDERWLADQVDQLGMGVTAARAIWLNWSEGRNVGRLHPGLSAGQYIATLWIRLDLAEAMAALPAGSGREVARVARVSESTVRRARGASNDAPPDPPTKVIGADGKAYPGRVVRAKEGDVIEPIASGETLILEGKPRVLADDPAPERLACEGDNHVPGCEHFGPVEAKPAPVLAPVLLRPAPKAPRRPESAHSAPAPSPTDLTGWKALELVLAAVEELSERDPAAMAAAIPVRRREGVAGRIERASSTLHVIGTFVADAAKGV